MAPDGHRALVTTSTGIAQIIRIADGTVEKALSLDDLGASAPDSPQELRAPMYSGSWHGDRVVANSASGLVVINVRDRLRIESVFSTPAFGHGIAEPVLKDDTHVVGCADLDVAPLPAGTPQEPAYDHALVRCDLQTAICETGPASPASSWTRWITNPSR